MKEDVGDVKTPKIIIETRLGREQEVNVHMIQN